jgi:S-formylglutathione hydrolase FrmB
MRRNLLIVLFCAAAISLPARAQSRIDCNALNSRILKYPVHYCVYLPAGYDASANAHPARRYPVLYFLHGLGDNEQTLFNSGGWTLLDDMHKQHKIGEFLIVAPEGRRTSSLISKANIASPPAAITAPSAASPWGDMAPCVSLSATPNCSQQ